MLRRIVVCVLVGLFVWSVVSLADSSGCGCNASAAAKNGEKGNGHKNDDELQVTTEEAQEAMEWQCIVVDIIIEVVNCKTRPCDSLYWACLVTCDGICGAALAAGCLAILAETGIAPAWCIFSGAPCGLVACPAICRASVPWCETCETKVTKVYSCGWVFTE
jgi:hypothetical protein